MSVTHTPGPWMVADKGYGWDHFAAIVTTTGIVANCHIAALSRDYSQTAADARLIAAAPDLLTAAKAMLAAYHLNTFNGEPNALHDAIAKAERKA